MDIIITISGGGSGGSGGGGGGGVNPWYSMTVYHSLWWYVKDGNQENYCYFSKLKQLI